MKYNNVSLYTRTFGLTALALGSSILVLNNINTNKNLFTNQTNENILNINEDPKIKKDSFAILPDSISETGFKFSLTFITEETFAPKDDLKLYANGSEEELNIKVSEDYTNLNDPFEIPCRFDVFGLTPNTEYKFFKGTLTTYENAVGLTYKGESPIIKTKGGSSFPLWAEILIPMAIIGGGAIGGYFILNKVKDSKESTPTNSK